MVLGFILLWVLLGLGVFFVAMRGGPRGARASLHGESQLVKRLVTLGIVLLFVVGLGVPALVLAFNGENKASVGVGGLHLNTEQQHGRTLFARSCATCHTLAGAKAVGRVGPNLDVLLGSNIATVSGRKALVLDAIANGRARGMGQMPALLYQSRDARAVADFVSAVAGH
ncbi:MAG TPA: c-type cytochrome [Solirubrobacteraceae bacterium]|nr:c-type cytochrome [Solirubrobacteraceae bacterium]